MVFHKAIRQGLLQNKSLYLRFVRTFSKQANLNYDNMLINIKQIKTKDDSLKPGFVEVSSSL